jgi:hypothetical protein
MTMIKKMVWIAVLAFSTGTLAKAQTSATVKDELFAGTEVFAKGASDVTEITMDPDTLGLVAGRDKQRAHSMVLNVVRTYSYDKPGMYRIEDVDTFRNKLNTGDWHCSVHTREMKNASSTDVCNRRRTDDLVETAIVTVEPKELTFIHTIRRRGEGEHSEMGMYDLPGLPGLSNLPMLAMISPNIDMNINVAMAKAQVQAAMMSARMARGVDSMHVDDAEIQRLLDEAQGKAGAIKSQLWKSTHPDVRTSKQPSDTTKQPE